MSKTRDTGYLNNILQYTPTGVSFVSGSTTLLSVSSSGNLTTTGTITAQTLVVQTVTSSISFITGSTKFGALSSNTHQFTGSIYITGSNNSAGYIPKVNISGLLGNSLAYDDGTTVHVNAVSNGGGTKLYVSSGANGLPVTSGTTQTYGAFRIRGGDAAVLDFGLNSINTWVQATDYSGLNNFYNILLNPRGGNVIIGTTTDNSIAALQINGGINTTLGYKYTYSLGTISQNTTITQSIPNGGAGFYLISNGGNNSGLFMITRAGGSLGCQLVFSTNSNGDIVCGTTSEPAGGNYLRLWMSSAGVLSIKNVNAYTGPYYLTAICTF